MAAKKLTTSLKLRLSQEFVILALLCGCESLQMTEKVKRALEVGSKMLPWITDRTLAEQARNPSIDVVSKARER